MNCYFITGATGVVGSAIVPRLLDREDTEVFLLIRATGEENLQDRLGRLLEFWNIDKDSPRAQRITVMRGDITREQFGLGGTEYRNLTRQCTHIIHAAADVHMNRSLAEARQTAVDSARHIVSLASAGLSAGSLKKVEFLSTVGVGGRMQRVPEEWLVQDRVFHNTYEQSKAETERYLSNEIQTKNLPITVHRPSMIVGDSITGKVIHYQIFYHLCEFLSGAQTGGLVPRIKQTQLDTIPLDYVADAIIWSSRQSSTIGQVLQLCSGPRHSVNIELLSRQVHEMWRAEAAVSFQLRLVPLRLFKSCLPLLKKLAPRKFRGAVNNLHIFLAYASDQQSFENKGSQTILEAAGFELPRPEDYLEIVIREYLANKQRSL